MNIRLAVNENLKSLKWNGPTPSVAAIKAAAKIGMERYQDFLQCSVGFSQSGVKCYADGLTKYGAQASDWVIWYKQTNSIVFNNRMANSGKWTLKGIEKAITHELGHKYLWPFHVDHWPNLNGGGHVMKLGAGSDYFGTFSPWEIYYFLTKGWKLAKRPVHPFARQYAASTNAKWKAANLEKLKMIVNSYGSYHAKLYAWQTTGVQMTMPDLDLPTGVCLGCKLEDTNGDA